MAASGWDSAPAFHLTSDFSFQRCHNCLQRSISRGLADEHYSDLPSRHITVGFEFKPTTRSPAPVVCCAPLRLRDDPILAGQRSTYARSDKLDGSCQMRRESVRWRSSCSHRVPALVRELAIAHRMIVLHTNTLAAFTQNNLDCCPCCENHLEASGCQR